MSLSLTLDGVGIRDRETGTEYILHNDCHGHFLAVMAAHAVDLSRFVVIAPVNVETCNYGNCTH